MNGLAFVFLGFLAGIISGLVGIGGGVVLVPALVYVFAFSQQQAEGTTLAAMVPPIGALAAYVYYRAGAVNVPAAAWIAAGFVIGGFIGAKFATSLQPDMLRRIFGGFIIAIGAKMLWS